MICQGSWHRHLRTAADTLNILCPLPQDTNDGISRNQPEGGQRPPHKTFHELARPAQHSVGVVAAGGVCPHGEQDQTLTLHSRHVGREHGTPETCQVWSHQDPTGAGEDAGRYGLPAAATFSREQFLLPGQARHTWAPRGQQLARVLLPAWGPPHVTGTQVAQGK